MFHVFKYHTPFPLSKKFFKSLGTHLSPYCIEFQDCGSNILFLDVLAVSELHDHLDFRSSLRPIKTTFTLIISWGYSAL